jgi:hypothetical protein
METGSGENKIIPCEGSQPQDLSGDRVVLKTHEIEKF